MSCKTLNLNKCEIKGSTFQGTTFNFGSRDISNDVFSAKIYNRRGQELAEITNSRNESFVYFDYSSIENLSEGLYQIKFWADFMVDGETIRELIASEDLTINKP